MAGSVFSSGIAVTLAFVKSRGFAVIEMQGIPRRKKMVGNCWNRIRRIAVL
jgi:hypothetical protein